MLWSILGQWVLKLDEGMGAWLEFSGVTSIAVIGPIEGEDSIIQLRTRTHPNRRVIYHDDNGILMRSPRVSGRNADSYAGILSSMSNSNNIRSSSHTVYAQELQLRGKLSRNNALALPK